MLLDAVQDIELIVKVPGPVKICVLNEPQVTVALPPEAHINVPP